MSRKICFAQNINFLFLLLKGLFLLSFSSFAQESERSITVKYISDQIRFDGVLDEAAWQKADKGSDFWQFFPTDSARTKYPTEFRLLLVTRLLRIWTAFPFNQSEINLLDEY